MTERITIRINQKEWLAELYNTPTAQAIILDLPIQSTISTWGSEIYFRIPTLTQLEPNAVEQVKIGDLAYWPTMPAFCIFFGPTPASMDSTPRAAAPVNVFGRLINPEIAELEKIQPGELIEILIND